MPRGSLLIGLAKSLGVVLLALVVLWPAAEKAGTADSEAVIQVMERQVQIILDDQIYPIDDENPGPVVCQIRPGQHRLRMVRGGTVIQDEEFALQPGQQGVFTAWDQGHARSEDPGRLKITHDRLILGRRRSRRN